MNKIILMCVVVLACLALGCADVPEQTTMEEQAVQPEPVPDKVCYVDLKLDSYNSIGDYYEAPAGHHYIVATVYIKNEAYRAVSTNPWNWVFIANGITYNHDVATYADPMNHQTVDVGNGGEIETMIAFLVPTTVTSGMLDYTGFNSPTIERTSYY